MIGLRRCLYLIVLGLFLVGMSGCGMFVKYIPSGKILAPTDKDHFVNVGGINYHYTEYPAEGPDVVMLHGFASSTYTWEKVAPYLQDAGYHVWALDMKGFGWSDKPKGAKYDVITLTEEVNAWMDKMGLEDVVFVGNSLGGSIAGLMAIKHPDKIDRGVLIDAGGYPQKFPFVMEILKVPFASSLGKRIIYGRWMIKWNVKEVFFHKDWVTKEQVDAYYDRLRTENAPEAQISVARTVNFNEMSEFIQRIPTIKGKTLIIWGREDKWIPLENGYRFKRELPNSTLVVIPECGHIAQEEYPELTARLIRDFIEDKPIKESPLPEE